MNHSQVGVGVGADDRCRVFRGIVHEDNFHPGSLLDDVIVRQDIAVPIHYDAGAETLAALVFRLGELRTALPTKEAVKEILQITAAARAAVVVLIIVPLRLLAAPRNRLAAGLLRSGFRDVIGLDIYYRRLKHFGKLGKFTLGLNRGGDHKRRGVRGGRLFFPGLCARLHQSADHNTDRKREQYQSERQKFLSSHFIVEIHCLPAPIYLRCYQEGDRFGRVSSTHKIPAKIIPAPTLPRFAILSPVSEYDVSQAIGGSRAKIKAARVGDVYCCAHAWVVKASAVASNPVISTAAATCGVR